MELQILIYIAAAFLAVMIIFKIIKSVIKTVFLVLALVIVLSAVAGFFVIKDVNDLRENFFTKQKVILITDKSDVNFAFRMSEFSMKNLTFITGSDFTKIESAYAKKDYKTVLGKDYRMIAIGKELFGGAAGNQSDVTNKTVSSGPVFILNGYREGKIIVYPETSLFKAIRFLIVSTDKARELITRK